MRIIVAVISVFLVLAGLHIAIAAASSISVNATINASYVVDVTQSYGEDVGVGITSNYDYSVSIASSVDKALRVSGSYSYATTLGRGSGASNIVSAGFDVDVKYTVARTVFVVEVAVGSIPGGARGVALQFNASTWVESVWYSVNGSRVVAVVPTPLDMPGRWQVTAVALLHGSSSAPSAPFNYTIVAGVARNGGIYSNVTVARGSTPDIKYFGRVFGQYAHGVELQGAPVVTAVVQYYTPQSGGGSQAGGGGGGAPAPGGGVAVHIELPRFEPGNLSALKPPELGRGVLPAPGLSGEGVLVSAVLAAVWMGLTNAMGVGLGTVVFSALAIVYAIVSGSGGLLAGGVVALVLGLLYRYIVEST